MATAERSACYYCGSDETRPLDPWLLLDPNMASNVQRGRRAHASCYRRIIRRLAS